MATNKKNPPNEQLRELMTILGVLAVSIGLCVGIGLFVNRFSDQLLIRSGGSPKGTPGSGSESIEIEQSPATGQSENTENSPTPSAGEENSSPKETLSRPIQIPLLVFILVLMCLAGFILIIIAGTTILLYPIIFEKK